MAPRIDPAIATLSLGRPESGHTLPSKIRAAKAVGFNAVEISYFCLSSYATGTSRSLHDTAREIRVLLDELEMEAVSLAPLMNFEGDRDRAVHAEKLKTAKVWLQLAHILQAPLIQIPAAMISSSDSSYDLAIADLVELTDLAAAFDPPINVLYEFTSWSTYVRTWQSALDVALKVDRPNFSICLDVFHIGTFLIHENSMRIPAPPSSPSDHRQDLADSLKELSETTHASKFALYQLTDAAPIPDPLPPNQPVQDPARLVSKPCRAPIVLFLTRRVGYCR
ncbi:xylose isomerase-like protein [Hymenopellis radicata]|nr:xylose isomerase-like protein [Hymenopellis radicata]